MLCAELCGSVGDLQDKHHAQSMLCGTQVREFHTHVVEADRRVLCRAGFNLLDGYGGGSELAANFGFAMVRETSDHGFFNSWVSETSDKAMPCLRI